MSSSEDTPNPNPSSSNQNHNSQSIEELRRILEEMGLDSRGTKATLKKRLQNKKKKERQTKNQMEAAEKRWSELQGQESKDLDDLTPEETERRQKWLQHMEQRKKSPHNQPYEFLICLDVEATCDDNVQDYPQEIIEFPCIVVDTRTKEIVDEFHSFVRPVKRPKLTPFCTKLTGITQDVVDEAPTFPQVLARFERWLSVISLPPKYEGIKFVTDTNHDIGTFMKKQVKYCNIPFPVYFQSWINIRQIVKSMFGVPKVTLEQMVEKFDMKFQGRQHSGKDDATNVARVVIEVLKRGVKLKENGTLRRRHRGHQRLEYVDKPFHTKQEEDTSE